MTTATTTDLAQLNSDVARLVFGIQRCDKVMTATNDVAGPCSLDGVSGHLAADEPARNYLGLDEDDDWPGDWDGMNEIVKAMRSKGFGFAMGINPGGSGEVMEAWAGFTTNDYVDGYAECPTAPEAVARAAVAALKAVQP